MRRKGIPSISYFVQSCPSLATCWKGKDGTCRGCNIFVAESKGCNYYEWDTCKRANEHNGRCGVCEGKNEN